MNYDQFTGSMKRVLAFTQAPKTPADIENLNRYLQALYEAIGTMDAFTFEKVTVEICKNMGRGQRPMPGQFWAVYSRLKAESAASRPVEVCPSCQNTVWTHVHMLETKTGVEADFAVPCPECQSRHPLKDAPPRAGWVVMEKPRTPHDQEMLTKAKAMGPKGARFVLGMVEKGRVMFSDEVLVELMVKAAGTEAQSNPAVEKILDAVKVAVSAPVSGEQPRGEGNPEPEAVNWDEVA